MIKACLFDLDGTLANTLDSMAFAANRILRDLGLQELPTGNFRYYCGDGAETLVRRCLKDAGDPELVNYETAAMRYRELFAKDPCYKVTCYAGVLDVLHDFRQRNIKIAVCSNKPHPAAVQVIEKMFPDMFHMVVGQSEKIRKKPAPDAPLFIAGEFGVDPQECIYVGDSGTDMKTGKAAGMYTVGVLWGYRSAEELDENGADELAERPADLLRIYERITAEESSDVQ